MTVIPIAVQTAAVEALLDVLPTVTRLRAEPCSGAALAGRLGTAAVASFVGVTSADLAVVLADPAALDSASGLDSSLISRQDVLRPALESASGVFGIGVLGDTRSDDATALFADPATSVFELSGDGQITGWFAVRLRDNGVSNGAARSSQSVSGKLGRINSVQMSLTVEIGRTRMSVRDVLSLEPGAVIELDRSAGAPADILLNGRLIAHGEIVVVDQDYAVRITQILDVAESLT
ncbi:flagellar motor switch protein FliN [Cryobacterium sp. TMT1-19]|uniref:flagellar motor switch protein FliN n=1 Tax=unclassified Cryobacterium TaxID=2649013 RepID=UPI000CE4A7D4|nr:MULTISPECIES: flagellar motor switch protein FliN [unclassified Cryobacterium]TFB59493.1 flagellar motor switch protein FliN [Cryobacterium sp. Hz7]TFD35571.1 flagellar motor switch protein FliN [Cryobacterium sp. TMT1-19]